MEISAIIYKYEPQNKSLLLPYISDVNFGAIMMRYDTYASSYNGLVYQMKEEGAKHVQTLKSVHRALFQDLITQVKGQLNYYRKLFNNSTSALAIDPAQPFVLMTNNKKVQSRTAKDPATVWRNIKRLMDAGVILEKVNHGTRADYELHINPEFLLISDLAANNQQNSESAENGRLKGVLVAKCKPTLIDKNIENNRIIPVDNEKLNGVSLSANHSQSTDRNNYKNRGKQGDFSGNANPSPEIKPENNRQEQNSAAPAAAAINFLENTPSDPQERLGWFRAQFAIWLVQYMLKVLFAYHKHYKPAIYKAMEYAVVYFDGCKTYKEFLNRFEVLKWRVDRAAKWIEHSGFDFSNIYITDYLDVNNKTSGFINTKKWYDKHLEYNKYKQFKKNAKKKKTDREKLIEVLNKLDMMYQSGRFTVKDFIIAEDYVIRNINHLHENFIQLTEYIREGRYKNNQKTA